MSSESGCPGCGLVMPTSAKTNGSYHNSSYYHCSGECWSLFGEVLAAEFGNLLLFRRVHQLTVDAYAVQHAGGPHPDKSVCVHLVGLCLVHEHGLSSPEVAPKLQGLATRVKDWPQFEPPTGQGRLTVFDVAAAADHDEHAARVRAWAAEVWADWAEHHAAVRGLAAAALGGDSRRR